MEKYSEVNLTDDNFDDEIERLCEALGMRLNWELDNTFEWHDNLPDGYSAQPSCKEYPFTTYIRSKILPNIYNGNVSQAFEKGDVAVEFGNSFVSIYFETIL